MNYTQEQLENAVQHCRDGYCGPKGQILAAEVRRLQENLSTASTNSRRNGEIADSQSAELLKLRADLAARDAEILQLRAQVQLDERAKAAMFLEYHDAQAALSAREATIAGLVKAGDAIARPVHYQASFSHLVAAWDAAKSAAPVSSFTCTIEGFDMSTRTLQIQLPCALPAWHIGKQVTLSA